MGAGFCSGSNTCSTLALYLCNWKLSLKTVLSSNSSKSYLAAEQKKSHILETFSPAFIFLVLLLCFSYKCLAWWLSRKLDLLNMHRKCKFCTWMLNYCRCDNTMRISSSSISASLGGGSLISRTHQTFYMLSPLAETTDLNWVVHMKKLFQEFLCIWSLIVYDLWMFFPILNVLPALQVIVPQSFHPCYRL